MYHSLLETVMSHVPFRHAKQIEVLTNDQVLVDYDEAEGHYVAFFTDKMVCRVNKCATFKSKDDLDSYLQQFCHEKGVQYGRIRFVMRVGKRVVFTKDYSLSAWKPTMAQMDFTNLCIKEHGRAYHAQNRKIESSYVM